MRRFSTTFSIGVPRLDSGDHYEKYAAQAKNTDLIGHLSNDQLLVSALPNNFLLPLLIKNLEEDGVKVKKAQFKYSHTGIFR
jgi:hypothetical protein